MNNTKSPKVVVGAVIYNNDNKIFLAQSHKWQDKWGVPGGHLEWGETLKNAVKREVKEETNLDVTQVKLINVQESILDPEYYKPAHMIFLDYSCKAITNAVKLNDELYNYVWIDPQKALETLDIKDSASIFIKHFIQQQNNQ